METFEQGLRCQDVHSGLSNIDPHSAALTRLADTRIVGMAATLAATIRGQDVVTDAQVLRAVAADQLDVDPLAFEEVLRVLNDADLVRNVSRKSGRVVAFEEQVPFHENLYERLGQVWQERDPTQVEQELVATVDRLAHGPVPQESLAVEVGIEKRDTRDLLRVGTDSGLIQVVEVEDGPVLYSAFFGFENPQLLTDVMREYGTARFQEEFEALTGYQGLPIEQSDYPALTDAVARGLIQAATVVRPDKTEQMFAVVPYTIDRELLTTKKPIFDKALAVLACVRCGQHFGGATSIQSPSAILRALLDPSRDHTLSAHSSSRRQYQLLFRMQIVDFVPSGAWVQPRLIATEDNVAAVKLAQDLLRFGEPLAGRIGTEEEARLLLGTEAPYYRPIQTTHRRRRMRLSDNEWTNAMDVLMGRTVL